MDVYVTYCSPAGRRTYSKKFSMDEKAIADAISQSHRIVSEQEARKRERAKVTQKLRHKVLERDHYRCVHCGASAIDGAKLHVDHIIPIAHGGKTELDNLQTLCEACNLGKGSDLPMDGAGSTG